MVYNLAKPAAPPESRFGLVNHSSDRILSTIYVPPPIADELAGLILMGVIREIHPEE